MKVFDSESQLKEDLKKNKILLERSVVCIFERQTIGEKTDGRTKYKNNQGFNAIDCKMGTYMAKYIQNGITKFKKEYGQNLDGRFLETALKIMPKYSKQLYKIHKEKIEILVDMRRN